MHLSMYACINACYLCIRAVFFKLQYMGGHCRLGGFYSSPSLQNKDPGGGVGSTSRGWRLVGLGVGMGGFRDQGVETGRFR